MIILDSNIQNFDKATKYINASMSQHYHLTVQVACASSYLASIGLIKLHQ